MKSQSKTCLLSLSLDRRMIISSRQPHKLPLLFNRLLRRSTIHTQSHQNQSLQLLPRSKSFWKRKTQRENHSFRYRTRQSSIPHRHLVRILSALPHYTRSRQRRFLLWAACLRTITGDSAFRAHFVDSRWLLWQSQSSHFVRSARNSVRKCLIAILTRTKHQYICTCLGSLSGSQELTTWDTRTRRIFTLSASARWRKSSSSLMILIRIYRMSTANI
mmetsp:Transcript_35507/g.79956  ORF Transcript_35507/g.79956 Transcript_35507/m.79956 type:complete len:217 (-) Transcript_35507:2145-2795(-)